MNTADCARNCGDQDLHKCIKTTIFEVGFKYTGMAQEIEFIIDKVDGEIFLGQHDRTVKNELATNKAKAIGELTMRIVAAIESLQNNDSLYITIRKED